MEAGDEEGAPMARDTRRAPESENVWIWIGISELRAATPAGWSGLEPVPFPWVEEWLDRRGFHDSDLRALFTRCLRAVERAIVKHAYERREKEKAEAAAARPMRGAGGGGDANSKRILDRLRRGLSGGRL